jgi:hypothetical protein
MNNLRSLLYLLARLLGDLNAMQRAGHTPLVSVWPAESRGG